jgi:hypothetical protein
LRYKTPAVGVRLGNVFRTPECRSTSWRTARSPELFHDAPERIGEDRRRAAVDTVTALSFERHGNRIWRDSQMLLESERARHAVGEVAVPYGTCTEPTNVKAGGGACPVRCWCVGCDHFRTNVAFLPELQAYLHDLLRTRERLDATVDGIDDGAATPTQEEITRPGG